MEETTKNDFIRLDGSIATKEASDEVKSIADKDAKISAYYNVLACEAFRQYLDENDVVNAEIVNLRSSSKFLSEFEVTDIQLPNLSIYVRAVYDEDILFVPKKHFDFNITPDIYLFVKLDEELKQGEVLGFVKPEWINKKNDNGKYYFVNKSFLKPLSELISMIKNSEIKEQYAISDKTEETLEKIIMLYLDNDIDKAKLKKLIDYLKNSSVAREKLIEFENFERLSYMALQEFKDLDVENNDFTKYIKTLFPTDDFNFGKDDDMHQEETNEQQGGLYIDEDLMKNESELPEIKDEFDEFENPVEENISAEVEDIKIEEDKSSEIELAESKEENVQISEDKSSEIEDYDVASDSSLDDESMVVPEDLELNLLEDINESANGLDTETVIGLTEDVMYEGDNVEPIEEEQQEQESEQPETISDEEKEEVKDEIKAEDELAEIEFVTNEEIGNAISEINVSDDANGDKIPQLNFEKAENGISSQELDVNEENSIQHENINEIEDDEEDNNLKEIYNETSPTEFYDEEENNVESRSEAEDEGTNFAFATTQGAKMPKKLTIAISSAVVLLCLIGGGAWYFLSHNKSNNMADLNKEINNNKGYVSDLIIDDLATEQSQNTAKNTDVVADINLPSNTSAVNDNGQITIQKIKKDFSKPDTYISVSKIVWDVPEYLTYNDDFNNYLQTVGSSLKVNLSSDLLLIEKSPILDEVKLKISINGGGNYSASISQGCGTEVIDNLVLQSVKDTLNILKPPVNSLDTVNEDLYLTIRL